MASAGDVPQARLARSRALRGVYFVLGVLCLGLAYLSWLPGIPTVDFVVLAAFFFARSSERFHRWLLNHPVFGRIIRGYRAGLSRRTKALATIGIVASLTVSATLLTDSTVLRIILALVGVYAVGFVWTRPDVRGGSDDRVRPESARVELTAPRRRDGDEEADDRRDRADHRPDGRAAHEAAADEAESLQRPYDSGEHEHGAEHDASDGHGALS